MSSTNDSSHVCKKKKVWPDPLLYSGIDTLNINNKLNKREPFTMQECTCGDMPLVYFCFIDGHAKKT